MRRALAAIVLVAAAAAAAIAANVALLGWLSSDSGAVGRLSPRANVPAAPAQVIRPRTGPVERDENDD